MELPNRPQLDVEATAVLLSVMERHKEQLRRLLGSPPDENNVPTAFWRKIRREYEEELAAIFILVFLQSTDLHGWSAFAGSSDSTARTQARLWAGQQAAGVANSMTQTTMDLLERRSQKWRETLEEVRRSDTARSRQLLEELSADVDDALETAFGATRAGRVAQDQVTTAQTAGGEWAVRGTYGLSLLDMWKTNPSLSASGPCKICGPLEGTIREVWSAQFPDGPPQPHPGCVCEIIYENLPNLSERVQ